MEVRTERPVKSQEKLQALALVLQSETFARSDQLKKFLRYVAEIEDAGRGNEITEYSIGTEALGRPATYSPTDDSSVRGRAHDLRQKLEHFYKHERPDARLRVALHKGSYVPYYYELAPPPEETRTMLLVPAAPVATPPVPKRRSSFRGITAILLSFLAGSLTGGFWMLQRSVVDRKMRALVEGRDLFEGRE